MEVVDKSLNQDSPRKRGKKSIRIISLRIIVIITAIALSLVVSFIKTPLPAEIQVIDVNFDSNQDISLIDYYLSGRVINTGESPSNAIVLQIRFTDRDGNNLLTAQTSPRRNILQPGQEAPFGEEFTNTDINSYEGTMNYEITLLSA